MGADLRTAPVMKTSASFPQRYDFDRLAANNIRLLLSADATRTRPDYDPYTEWYQQRARWDLISDWTPLYKVIQSANILYEETPKVNDPSMSPAFIARVQGEAVFMRCLTYFFMIRIFGDVPYYTKAYQSDPLPRTSHTIVAQKCLEDLAAVKDGMPWQYADPTFQAVKATRGSIIALMMHLNMWLAGFDAANRTAYYQAVDKLGDELTNVGETQLHAIELYPISRLPEVFQGRSKEGLFEIAQNINYGEVIADRRRTYASAGIYEYIIGYGSAATRPVSVELAYYKRYLDKLYPDVNADQRVLQWFRGTQDVPSNLMSGITPLITPEQYMADESGRLQIVKFYNVLVTDPSKGNAAISNNCFIFRYADAILLQAEALAELGLDNKAEELLNRIRARAEAPLFPADPGDGNLKDAIFWERCKELMGEGHYYYDMVRTGKVYNPQYSYNPMSYSDFLAGAWRWPINPKALDNNPYMRLNDFWK
jgi:hypothetical protein